MKEDKKIRTIRDTPTDKKVIGDKQTPAKTIGDKDKKPGKRLTLVERISPAMSEIKKIGIVHLSDLNPNSLYDLGIVFTQGDNRVCSYSYSRSPGQIEKIMDRLNGYETLPKGAEIYVCFSSNGTSQGIQEARR